MILIARGHNSVTDEILRFIFLSGLVISFLASLLFVDIQFGTQSPLGLIKQKETKNNTENYKWTFSIGGTIQLPVYVIVFGLLGGYIRYLYEKSRFISTVGRRDTKKEELEKKDELHNDRHLIFLQSLRDISLFLLSPLLAIVVYFFLFNVGMDTLDGTYTIAVACFGVGLVTEDVIRKLKRSTNRPLAENGDQDEAKSKKELNTNANE